MFSIAIGVTLGLMAGYIGGRTDAFIMRIADIQLSFPAILIALLVFGVARGLIAPQYHEQAAIIVLIIAIGLSNWASYARTVRGSTLVEKNKDYVMSARVMGRSALAIMGRHVLPNVIGPVLVIATINLALAIIAESTLSFLGVGVPPTQPSLGTLIRVGQQFLFSGEWWILLYPCARSRAARAVDQPAGRLAARRAEPETAMTPVLSVRNLKVEFPTRRGTLTAIDDMSFDIAPGEVLGVVGESGAGKSITGTAVIGLIEPPGRIAGGASAAARPAHRQSAARGDAQDPRQAHRHGVPGPAHQPQSALSHRRPADRNHHDAHQPVERAGAQARRSSLLDEVGIPAAEMRIDDYPHQFSGGMRQRVVLALALAAEPELVIADEPTTALDVSVQAQIIALLKRLCRAARRRRHADHPRHGRDRRDRRPRRRDVCRPHRRDRPGARRDQDAAASLHQGPDGLDPVAHRREPTGWCRSPARCRG